MAFVGLLFRDGVEGDFRMRLERLAVVDAAIREALVRIERQRDFVEDFSARGYDMRAPLSLLSCLLVNLRSLENRRREIAAECEEIVGI